MPEEQAPEETQDTQHALEESGPAEGIPADTPESVDWEKRYGDLRPEYDRQNQRLSQFEEFYGQLADPETQAEALAALGLELEQEQAEEEYVDPDEALRGEVEGIKAYLSQQDEASQEQEIAQLEEQFIEQEFSSLPEHDKLSQSEREAVINLAYAYPDDEGLPDVKAAYEVLTQAAESSRERYLQSKKAQRVEIGTAGTDKVNLNDRDTRAKAVADIIEAESSEAV